MADTLLLSSPYQQALALLVTFWLNALLHGIYLTLFVQWLLLNHKAQSIYISLVCWFAFIFSNIDAGINLYLLIAGFWGSLDSGGPAIFFEVTNYWPVVWREFNYQLLVCICDAFMVYRLWRVWENKWWIVVGPIILLIVETVFGLIAPAQLKAGTSRPEPTIAIFLGFNTVLQVIITLLMAARLLNPRELRHLPAKQRTTRFQITRCVIESGSILTVALLIDVVLFAIATPFHWLTNISLTQVFAISTVLIILRIKSVVNQTSTSQHAQSIGPVSSGTGAFEMYGRKGQSTRPDPTWTSQTRPVRLSLDASVRDLNNAESIGDQDDFDGNAKQRDGQLGSDFDVDSGLPLGSPGTNAVFIRQERTYAVV